MNRRLTCIALAALLASPAIARAADEPAPPPTPAALSTAEGRFVRDASRVLRAKFPTPAAAEKAGYVRYTNEDETGAISYADLRWNSTSESAPSQLWYDVHGRLLGADYSVRVADYPKAPSLFGITPTRFFEEHAHIHYVVRNPDGSLTYSRAVGAKKYAATGLDPLHPTAAGLVKVGAVDAANHVATVFLFPTIWDVTVWVLPNPAGPFADANPNVKPSKMPSSMDMH
jgi:hypothetical protein